MFRILVIEDEDDIQKILENYLVDQGYAVTLANDGVDGITKFHNGEFDLVLLDIMMPKIDGFGVCELIRRESNVPIIMLTALEEEAYQIKGFDMKADDYVTKPFNPLEVIARVKAQLRRYAYLGGMEQKPPKAFAIGGIELDDEGKTVTLNGEEVALTPTEYDILKLFLANPGKVFSSKEIYSAVWDSDPMGAEGTIAVHIRHLREKLEIDHANPRYLKVVWGKGYKMEDKK